MATVNLKPGEYVLDCARKTIEVGENTPIKDAVHSMLFSVGHLLLRNNEKYELLFGVGIREWRKSEAQLIDDLSDLGESADRVAGKWAIDTLQMYWQYSAEEGEAAIAHLRMNKKEWSEYFAA